MSLLELLACLFRVFIICNLKEDLEVLVATLGSGFKKPNPVFIFNSKAGNQPVVTFNWDLNWVFDDLIVNKAIAVIIDELE